ncbi:peptide-methionine (S)-S-oxide reductase MsrA [Roseobacter sp. YSTF-M11]|uniref:Peptide methionine sulfoxide reductase MsrA n=1 Tax=Roseobacter insulae TaxID=2859783 RepID=A0A9X1FS66_9RHOB|nr:peptide-methionine (S)-S-oxide reductase MsrA [Roseobacter insulae]MBW4706730.1 peptide-methionine (S)-S-oxide reductase MsrA [Roseobacter insulae]
MLKLYTLQSIALAGMIAFGFVAQARTAHAAELETLTVAGGCFWCVEADFEKVKGVTEAVSGFAGGTVANPTYKQVTSGGTGHYEVVQISFDPSVVTRRTLLDLFFRSVDPTDAGGQFCDRGDSYRTAIFAEKPAQKSIAQDAKARAAADLGQSIVTPILGAAPFYPADAYHQDYYKGSSLVLTRFGPKRKASAYKAYREACGRDARVRELWGSSAPFINS